MRASRLLLATVALLGLVATGCAGSDTSSDAPGSEAPTTGEGDSASGGGASGTCLEGAKDCQDTGTEPGAPPPMGMCAEDAPDCQDVIVGDPDEPAVDEPLPPDAVTDPAEPEPRMVEPTDGLVDLHPIAWEGVDAGDDQAVTVRWWSGVEPCHALHDVEVDYAEDTVTITVIEGRGPGEMACIEIAEYKATRVLLDEPVGDRTIVDGAA